MRLGAHVQSVNKDGVVLDAGESLQARAVVIATEGPEAARLLQVFSPPPSRRVTCLYFVADTPPLTDALLILRGGPYPPDHLYGGADDDD